FRQIHYVGIEPVAVFYVGEGVFGVFRHGKVHGSHIEQFSGGAVRGVAHRLLSGLPGGVAQGANGAVWKDPVVNGSGGKAGAGGRGGPAGKERAGGGDLQEAEVEAVAPAAGD